MANEYEQYLYQKADINKIPLAGAMELSPLCNLDCKMCYIKHTIEEANREGGVKPVEFWLSLIPQLKAAGTLFVNLIGGEPFYYPDIEKLYNELFTNGFLITVTTNGILLAKKVPEWLIEKKPRFVSISVYGCSNETYKKVCGISKGYDLVCQAIENLKNAGIRVSLKTCISPHNINEIEGFYDLAERYHCKLELTAYNFPPVRKQNHEELDVGRLSPIEVAQSEMRNYRYKLGDRYVDFCQYLAGGQFAKKSSKHVNKFWCRAGVSTFWINWKGMLSPCGMLEDMGVSLEHYSFVEGWEQCKDIIDHTYTCQDCAECSKREICFACPAMVKSENGTFLNKPEYICETVDCMIQLAKESDY